MSFPKNEALRAALDSFVYQLVEIFDTSIDTVDYLNVGGNPKDIERWKKLVGTIPDKNMQGKKLAQKVLEEFIHELLFRQEDGCFKIQIQSTNGDWKDLNELTSGEAYGDFFDWLNDRSKYASITTRIAELE